MQNQLKQNLQNARQLLVGETTLVVLNNQQNYTFKQRGVLPLLKLLRDDPSVLDGAIVADKVIGKASAALMIKGRISCCYTDVISESALNLFKKYGILHEFSQIVPNILNRRGDGFCPMETAVKDTDDIEEAYGLILQKLKEMSISLDS